MRQAIDLIKEGERQMGICNACRYCEGFCAVFPAMERRLTFNEADIHYLANLCHNCAECYYACQYAPPHEFAVNVPKGKSFRHINDQPVTVFGKIEVGELVEKGELLNIYRLEAEDVAGLAAGFGDLVGITADEGDAVA